MPVRKRSPEEQAMHDRIEALKVRRRALVKMREGHLTALEQAPFNDATIVLARARAYLTSITNVAEADKAIVEANAAYKALRSIN